jgi:hypothetical protein
MANDSTNGTKSQERTDVVIVVDGFGRAIRDCPLAASGAFGLVPFVGTR